MNPFSQMQTFFLISSLGFIVLFVSVAIFLFYLIRSVRTLKSILEKVERGIDEIGDTTKDLLEDMRDSTIFNFLFRRKKRHKKDKNY